MTEQGKAGEGARERAGRSEALQSVGGLAESGTFALTRHAAGSRRS